MFTQLVLPERVIPRKSHKAKRLALRLNRKTFSIDLVIPRWTPTRSVNQFVEANLNWIDNTLTELPALFYFRDGAEFSFLGKNTTLKINKNKNVKRTIITHENDIISVETYLDDISPRLKRWIRQETLKHLQKLTEEKASQLNQTVQKVSVRDTHTRWGSCAHDSSISYSWRLAFAPLESIDYVVAHEVSHLKHMDHSKKFWNVCEKLCLDYKEGKNWMRENGLELMRYRFDEMPQAHDPI